MLNASRGPFRMPEQGGRTLKYTRGIVAGVPWTGRIVESHADIEPFLDWVRSQRGRVGFDLETCGLGIYTWGPGFIRLAQFGTKTEAWVVPVEHGPRFADAVRQALDILPSLVGHNMIAFDGLAVDEHLGFPLEKICAKSIDTLVPAKLIDPRKREYGGVGHKLKQLAGHYVDPTAPDTQEDLHALFAEYGWSKKSGLGWSNIPWDDETYTTYGCLDVVLVSHLLEKLEVECKRLSVRPALWDFEHNTLRMTATMSRTAMLVDAEYTEKLDTRLQEESEQFVSRAASEGVENINSTDQIAKALLAAGEKIPERTASGKVKVDKNVLMRLADLDRDWKPIGSRTPNALAEAVLRGKRAGKWRQTYVDTFLKQRDANGRIHPNINSLEARTGRMSITNPAVQTLPSSDWMIRRCLVAEPGHRMASVDFSAVEMRVLAALADVKRMREGFLAGEDIHWFTARTIVGPNATKKDRKIFKGAGFGKVYGGGIKTISAQTGAPESEIGRAVSAYDSLYPEIPRKARRWQREAFDNDMVFISATGRRLPLDRDRTYAVVNYACQSAARDLLCQAMLNMDAAGLLPYLRLPIHDEVVLSAPEAEIHDVAAEVSRCMTMSLRGVPITSESEVGGKSWGSLYMIDKDEKPIPELLVKEDPYYAAHPDEAFALLKS